MYKNACCHVRRTLRKPLSKLLFTLHFAHLIVIREHFRRHRFHFITRPSSIIRATFTHLAFFRGTVASIIQETVGSPTYNFRYLCSAIFTVARSSITPSAARNTISGRRSTAINYCSALSRSPRRANILGRIRPILLYQTLGFFTAAQTATVGGLGTFFHGFGTGT